MDGKQGTGVNGHVTLWRKWRELITCVVIN